MKKLLISLLIIAILFGFVSKDKFKYRYIPNTIFKKGEHIEYVVHYGFINAGKGVVDVEEKQYLLNGRVCYKIDLVGKTTGAAGVLVRVNDTWRTYLDTAAFIPHRFFRNIEEGIYRRKEITDFNPLNNSATIKFEEFGANDPPEKRKKTGTKSLTVPDYVQDMISGYYYLRTLDFAKLQVNERIKISGVLEDALYHMEFIYGGKEEIKTKFGKIYAHKLTPVMFKNQLFDGESSIRFWVSDDKNRVPVRVEADMFIGKVVIEISDYKNLRHKFTFAK